LKEERFILIHGYRGSVGGHLAPELGQNIMVAGVCGRGGSSAHGGQEVRDREIGAQGHATTSDLLPQEGPTF
jgi:hypothetical protein